MNAFFFESDLALIPAWPVAVTVLLPAFVYVNAGDVFHQTCRNPRIVDVFSYIGSVRPAVNWPI
jgi:hypothetical protein